MDRIMLQTVAPLMTEYNVTAVFNGHDHHYERGDIGGVTYVLLGSGGGAQDPILTARADTDVYVSGVPCFSRIYVTETSARLVTTAIDGTVLDDAIIGGVVP
jgi:hypothetical protein